MCVIMDQKGLQNSTKFVLILQLGKKWRSDGAFHVLSAD